MSVPEMIARAGFSHLCRFFLSFWCHQFAGIPFIMQIHTSNVKTITKKKQLNDFQYN